MKDRLRFLHTADIHLHAPHKYLGKYIKEREQDFRNTLVRMKDFILIKRIPIWLIAGDLWEHERVTPPTISFLQKLFADLPDTRIFISPGNHDPYLQGSYYVHTKWPANVTIFTTEWSSYPLPEWQTCIYGIGFAAVHQSENPLRLFPGKQSGFKRHIMVLHSSVSEVIAESESSPYAPVTLRDIEELRLDYVALGHIHKPRIFYNREQQILAAYPGSPESLRASETGERHALLGDWQDEQLHLQAVATQSRLYRRVDIDLTGANDYEELMARIRKALLHYNREELLQVYLTGEISRHLELDPSILDPLAKDFFYIQWINSTMPDYDIEQLTGEHSVLAHFIEKIELIKSQERDAAKLAELEEAKILILDAFIRKEVLL